MNNPIGAIPGTFGGIRIVENHNMVKRVQFRFPRSKSKRIAKKFRKNTANYRTEPDRKILHMPGLGVIVCHPSVAAQLRAEIRRA